MKEAIYNLTSTQALPDGVQAVDNPLEGYTLIPMEWTGSIKEGADPITLSGTAEVSK